MQQEVTDSMLKYIFNSNYDTHKYESIIIAELKKIVNDFEVDFDFENQADLSIFIELFLYRNHKKIPSLTEIYLEKNKFRNPEKIKMLECMKNSYVGLFEVIDSDFINGYVTYKDIITKKEFKIIDVSMSSTFLMSKDRVFTYNRIITFDDISFTTGIHCMFSSNSKYFEDYLKFNNKKCSSFTKCLLLYDIYKKEDYINTFTNTKYGR